MFQSFFKTSIRSLLRHKGYTIINILGLTSGVAAFLIICLYIQWERSYDNIVPDRENTYRLVQVQQAEGVGEQHVAVTSYALAPLLENSLPGLIDICRILPMWDRFYVIGDQQYEISNPCYADPSLFTMMGGEILYGESESILNDPSDLLLSESEATSLFGSPEEALNKLVEKGGDSYVVKAVFKDIPPNTHFEMDAIFSFQKAENLYPWLNSITNNTLTTYIQMEPGTDPEAFGDVYMQLAITYLEEAGRTDIERDDINRMYLQSVADIHLRSTHLKFQNNHNPGNYKIVFVFILVAGFIILIACINFINITIAQSVKKAREVGVRKTLGASRKSLIAQFFGEAFFLSLISVILAVALVELFLPGFNRIMNLDLYVDIVHNPLFNRYLLLIIIGISIIAGLYPALFLSRFDPVQTLKGSSEQIVGSGNILQKILVITQFTVSVVLILSVMIVKSQTHYVMTKDLGMNMDYVIRVPMKSHNNKLDVDLFKNAILKNPDILAAASASNINGVSGTQSTVHVVDSSSTEVQTRMGYIDYGFFKLMEIPLVTGRYFDESYGTDDAEAVIINRAMMEYLELDNPIGKQFEPFYRDSVNRRVVGVIEDYNYYSLHWNIEPAAWRINDESYNMLGIRVQPETMESSLAFIEDQWDELFPKANFEYEFATDAARNQYDDLKRTDQVFGWFSILSIVISILGLWGVSSLNIDRRVKEIGVRKVLGGSVNQIMFLLQKDFLKLVALAAFIAMPIGWYLMHNLLSQFAFRIKINVWYFLGAIITALIVASLTIGVKAFRAAQSNPVEALKYE